MKNYQKTKIACYLGFVTQAIAANFAPLLFLKFHSDYNISLGSSSYLEEKLERLSYILPEIEGMQGTLHLENFSPNNTDVVFEKQKDSVE